MTDNLSRTLLQELEILQQVLDDVESEEVDFDETLSTLDSIDNIPVLQELLNKADDPALVAIATSGSANRIQAAAARGPINPLETDSQFNQPEDRRPKTTREVLDALHKHIETHYGKKDLLNSVAATLEEKENQQQAQEQQAESKNRHLDGAALQALDDIVLDHEDHSEPEIKTPDIQATAEFASLSRSLNRHGRNLVEPESFFATNTAASNSDCSDLDETDSTSNSGQVPELETDTLSELNSELYAEQNQQEQEEADLLEFFWGEKEGDEEDGTQCSNEALVENDSTETNQSANQPIEASHPTEQAVPAAQQEQDFEPAPAMAKAPNPYLPQDVLDMLSRERIAAQESAEEAHRTMQRVAEQKEARLHASTQSLTEREKQRLVDDILDEVMPKVRASLEEKIKKLLNSKLHHPH